MKIIKKILFVIAGIIVLALVAALFVSKEYSVKREITINKPSQEVYDYVKFIKNQEHYNKWVMMDPNMKKGYQGTDGTVGFVYAWDSQKDDVGKGEEEIKVLEEGKKINLEVRFIRPFEGLATTEMTTEAISPTQTKVSWGMSGRSAYPMNLTNTIMDGMLGADLEQSLQTLKGILEK
ncbi:SRPBCC family protein [Dyadobacter jiangsuensis]|uniref:Polyketide cyclase/dehydrase/lipid transport protein n=1 Tax=Dyadobacter jiangsuensis TaxID=1591085 RepID=A0A2P8FMF8_9BACT|nr:SRPBCC family protein [Dyadobacter jiangsuensis]PSL22886.1 polyketide cyclase/dehydrase/lipid transport protein [Dyadobacter jiangsuensis]